MPRNRGLALHTTITTDTTITTAPSLYYGALAYCFTTGPSKVLVYDALTTNSGALIGGAYATGSAAAQFDPNMSHDPIVCGSGIHANVTCTSGVDSIVIFYGPVK